MRSLPRALRSTRLVLGVLASCLALTASACSAAPAEDADDAAASLATPGERSGVGRAVPALRVETLADGLDHPWDVKPIGGGRLLLTQRDRATLSIWEDDELCEVDFPSRSVWVSGETGLMGLEVDPDVADNGRFWTCQGGTTA